MYKNSFTFIILNRKFQKTNTKLSICQSVLLVRFQCLRGSVLLAIVNPYWWTIVSWGDCEIVMMMMVILVFVSRLSLQVTFTVFNCLVGICFEPSYVSLVWQMNGEGIFDWLTWHPSHTERITQQLKNWLPWESIIFNGYETISNDAPLTKNANWRHRAKFMDSQLRSQQTNFNRKFTNLYTWDLDLDRQALDFLKRNFLPAQGGSSIKIAAAW